MGISGVDGPRALLATLADELEANPASAEHAKAVRVAVDGLSADAPLTLALLDNLDLDPATSAALVFSWLAHRYPDVVHNELRCADNVADVVRNLLWDANDVAPAFAEQFHAGMTAEHVVSRHSDVVAFEQRASEGMKIVGASDSAVVVAPTNGPKMTAALGDDGWAFTWTADGQPHVAKAKDLDYRALATTAKVVATAVADLGTKPIFDELDQAIRELQVKYREPVAPNVNALDKFLRFALGAHRAGETELDTLNDLVELVLETGQTSLHTNETYAENDPLRALFPGSAGRDVVPLPGAPDLGGASDTSSDELTAVDGSTLVNELKEAIGPRGAARGLPEELKEISVMLEQIARALSRLRFRGARSQ